MATLTVTTYAKYLKVTDGVTTKRIIYANLFDITNDSKAVWFNTTDPHTTQIVGYALQLSDVDTFDTVSGMTTAQMADAILAKVIA